MGEQWVSRRIRVVGGGLVLGLWLTALASASTRFEPAWAPAPRETSAPAAAPAAEPNESDQDQEPKPSSLDDSTEPTPV
jgi:hypothetical protein